MSDLKAQLKELQELAVKMEQLLPQVEEILPLFTECFQKGNTVFACGNGGSAADALHLCEELVGRYRGNRRALPAICLNADATAITCIANDWSFDAIYSRQLEALGRTGDVLVAFSTSGNSGNILEALTTARARGITTVLLTGKDGGKGKNLADHTLIIPSPNTARIQEIHTWILHVIMEEIEEQFPLTV
jgi:D-sedoheptulose 7-phosphate isomerase